MLTIPAMVRVGPWILERVQKDPRWTSCERCSQRIKEVWTCTVDADRDDILLSLGGQSTWRIGSTCGPTLLGVSQETWKEHTKGSMRRLRLLIKIEKLIQDAAAAGFPLSELVAQRHTQLSSGTATKKEVNHGGLLAAAQRRALERFIAEHQP